MAVVIVRVCYTRSSLLVFTAITSWKKEMSISFSLLCVLLCYDSWFSRKKKIKTSNLMPVSELFDARNLHHLLFFFFCYFLEADRAITLLYGLKGNVLYVYIYGKEEAEKLNFFLCWSAAGWIIVLSFSRAAWSSASACRYLSTAAAVSFRRRLDLVVSSYSDAYNVNNGGGHVGKDGRRIP